MSHSQRKRKRENHRRREHQNILPRNGYTPRVSYIDEIIGTDFPDLLEGMSFSLQDRKKLASIQGPMVWINPNQPAVWEPVEEFETPEFAKVWRQANPIIGEVVKPNDDGRVGAD